MPWNPQEPESSRHLLLGVPGIDAGEIDMLPTERQDMLEHFVWNNPPLLLQKGRGAAQIDSVPVHDGADLASLAGTMTMNVLNAVAQFERDLLIERTQSGLKRTKSEGKAVGRPSTLSEKQKRDVLTIWRRE